MQEQFEHFLATGENGNLWYFTILKAQVSALGLLTDGILNAEVRFSDVSLIPAGGRQSPDDDYNQNVALSVATHQAVLTDFRPELVVVGSKRGYHQFCAQVLENLSQEVIPRLILRMSNPSRRAHYGSLEQWRTRYGDLSIPELLRRDSLPTESAGNALGLRAELYWRRAGKWDLEIAVA